jgi:cytochrome P450
MIAPGPHPLAMLTQFYRDPLGMFVDAQQRWGDVVRFAIPGYLVHQVTSWAEAKYVLTQPHYQLSETMGSSLAFVGNGLATNIGESWAVHRRMMQPAFHRRTVSRYTEVIRRTIDTEQSRWQSETDLAAAFVRLNHHLLGQIILGIDFNQHPEVLLDLHLIRTYVNRRVNAIVGLPEVLMNPFYQRYQQAIRRFDRFVQAAIEDPQPDSLLADLKQARDPRTGTEITEQQLRDEINTAFFNAYDDPGSALSWVIWLLSQHPQVEQQLRDEVTGATSDSDLPFVRAVLDEALRLYPPTWSMLRDVQQDDEISGYHIPAGSTILINSFILHRHHDYYEQPDAFIPGREKPFDLSFGHGPRQCIGRDLALLQMQLMLSSFIKQFEFRILTPSVQMDAASSLRMKSGLVAQLTKHHP